jgi:hypothetical protein
MLLGESPDRKESAQGDWGNETSQFHLLHLLSILLPEPTVWFHINGTPKPAARSVAISGPRKEQQSANLPSITTAGTVLIPKRHARFATSGFRMLRTVTSQDGQAAFLTSSIVSTQQEQPALKTSILLFSGIFNLLCGFQERDTDAT